jgi:hypothetical protein
MSKGSQKDCKDAKRIAKGLQKHVKSSANGCRKIATGLQKDCIRIAK